MITRVATTATPCAQRIRPLIRWRVVFVELSIFLLGALSAMVVFSFAGMVR